MEFVGEGFVRSSLRPPNWTAIMRYEVPDSQAEGRRKAPHQIDCAMHGRHDFAIACIHVCKAINSGASVGFFRSAGTDGPRADAWCRSCELWRRQNPGASLKEWMQEANFQLLCVHCWDEAKALLYDRFQEAG